MSASTAATSGSRSGGKAEPLRHDLGTLLERLLAGAVSCSDRVERPVLGAQVGDLHRTEDLHEVTGDRRRRSIEVVELLPQRVHPGERVVRRQLEHDASRGSGIERGEERNDVGHVVDDVVHHRDVVPGDLGGDVRPLTDDLVVLDTCRVRALGECLEHGGVAVHRSERSWPMARGAGTPLLPRRQHRAPSPGHLRSTSAARSNETPPGSLTARSALSGEAGDRQHPRVARRGVQDVLRDRPGRQGVRPVLGHGREVCESAH